MPDASSICRPLRRPVDSRRRLARPGTCAALVVIVALAAVDGATADDKSRQTSQILVSRQLAAAEGLAVGEIVHLAPDAGGDGARPFRIAGIYEPVPDPARLGLVPREVRLHLPDLLALTREPDAPLDTEHVERINIALVDPDDALEVAREINARTPGVTARLTTEASGSAATFRVLRRFHLAIALVTIIAATVFLLALTIMLVDHAHRRTA